MESVAVERLAVESVAVESVAVESVAVESVAVESSQWSPSQWSPRNGALPSGAARSPSDPQLFSSAQTASLLAVSAGTGTGTESVSVNTWNNTGYFYVRVQGKNGSFDPDTPFTLSVERDGSVCQDVADQTSTPVAGTTGKKTLILTDSSRLAIDTTLADKLGAFAGRTEVNGVVVDVNTDPVVRSLNTQADSKTGCPYAKNLVASAIKRIVDAYRASNPIKYVVLVGGDARDPVLPLPGSRTRSGPESDYIPPVRTTPPRRRASAPTTSSARTTTARA